MTKKERKELDNIVVDNFKNEKRLKELDKNLYKKYNSIVTYLDDYLTYNIREEIKNDLLGQFLDCYSSGQDINEIIGDDLKVYCDDIIKNIPRKTKKPPFFKYILEFIVTTIVFYFIMTYSNDTYLTPKNFILYALLVTVFFIIIDKIVSMIRFSRSNKVA